jgi:hypothetical protein
MSDQIERWAMRLAVGNNGGSWDEHYTTAHKEFWRGEARDLIDEMKDELTARDPIIDRIIAESDKDTDFTPI